MHRYGYIQEVWEYLRSFVVKTVQISGASAETSSSLRKKCQMSKLADSVGFNLHMEVPDRLFFYYFPLKKGKVEKNDPDIQIGGFKPHLEAFVI